jgi:uncharacterized membrane protein
MSRAERRQRQRAPAHVAEAATSPRAWEVVALAAAGLAVAGYLTWTKLAGGTALFCAEGGGCNVVQASRYSVLLGIPTALWGAVFYVVVAALALWGLTPRRWVWAFALAASGVAFSVYLTVLSIVEIRATCAWCLTSAAIALALLGALVWRRPPTKPTRWPRSATIGVASGALTVLVAAFIFAAPRGSAEYQSALARHLRDSGAVMYGAFW